MRNLENATDFINRVVSNNDNIIIRVTANDILPIVGTKENVLRKLFAKNYSLYVNTIKIANYDGIDNILIDCLFRNWVD